MTNSTPAPLQIQPARIWQTTLWGFVALFGAGAFVHAGLALRSRPDSYRTFADAALFDWVYDGWQNVFMAHPTLWALLLGAGEFVIAILLVRARRLGYVAVVGFHIALMLFGWGFWLWSVPALAFAVPAIRHAFRTASST